MARFALCVVALMLAGGLSEPVPSVEHPQPVPVVVPQEQLEYQKKFLTLFFHPHEPLHLPEHQEIANSWNLKSHIDQYQNTTAVLKTVELINNEWVLPQGVPFSVVHPNHRYQVVTLFNLLYSAKTLETLYKTAVYLRGHINEYLFVYVTTSVLYHRQDTQGFPVPPLYEIFPSFFNNGEIMTTAQRISTHGMTSVEYYPSTYVWDNNVVIRMNETIWPYLSQETPISYFTHDYGLNNFYYNMHILYPAWLGGETVSLVKDHRGEWYWFIHKQLLARYYMERLSNGLDEIPVLGLDVVEQGYTSGLVHQCGIPYPVRPNYYYVEQPHLVDEIREIVEYEHRVRDAIDMGYVVTPTGEHVDIHHPDAIDIIGRVIQANVDSPNIRYYKDFVSIWKMLLGNSMHSVHQEYYSHGVPYVVPSVLEQPQTALRDPAFYMIWKRVLNLFNYWQQQMPFYTQEELGLPGVVINSVDVDKMVTYFENTYMNVTNHLHLNEYESAHVTNTKSVVVQIPRLNHKVFSVRVSVKSDAPKQVVVRMFLAPKYDSAGVEIPLHVNSVNFFQFDQFITTLKSGDNMISHSSNENQYLINDLTSSYHVYEQITHSLSSHEQYVYMAEHIDKFPRRLVLPKGRVGGMPYVVMVHISEYHAPNVVYGTGYNPSVSLGVGSGARRMTSQPLGFPVDRPLYDWQIVSLKNIAIQDVMIYHKHTPEIVVHHVE
ncbi:hypothetical protein ACJJTC_005864 [Scirpophaga incertulas]